MKNELLYVYRNGNYFVEMYSDGTKYRFTNDDSFIPEYPECIDVTITEKCDGNCPYCYLNCTTEKKHCERDTFFWFCMSVRYGTEVALNVNDLSYPNLAYYLKILKRRNVIANITINQRHFMKNLGILHNWENEGLFKGLGISYVAPQEGLIEAVKSFANPVIHTICGILTQSDIEYLQDKDLKILILGYKNAGRGSGYATSYNNAMCENMKMLFSKLYCEYKDSLLHKFNVVAFDNLALEQLGALNIFVKPNEEYLYMGGEGEFSFYIDLVNKKFAQNSMSYESFPIEMNTIEDIFRFIRMKSGYNK